MSKSEYSITPTSKNSADCTPVILSETEAGTRRTVFIPKVVTNDAGDTAGVKGTFVYERKSGSTWNRLDDNHLNSLKSGEGFKLSLKSDAVRKLFEFLEALYHFREEEGGVPSHIKRFVPQEVARRIGSASADDIIEFFTNQEKADELVKRLKDWDPDDLRQVTTVAGLSTLKKAYSTWVEAGPEQESYWQRQIMEFPFVLSQLFAVPTVIHQREAYVGGKNVSNQGGNVTDFLLRSEVTNNAVVVEIKTPMTSLLQAQSVRGGTYNVSSGLSAAVQQVLTQRQTLTEEYLSMRGRDQDHPTAFNSRCVVIVGNTREFQDEHEDLNRDKVRSFELYRSNQRHVDIVTYDELFQKTKTLIDLLEGSTDAMESDPTDDLDDFDLSQSLDS